MSMRSTWLAMVALVTSCGPSAPPRHPSNRARWCDAVCDHRGECGLSDVEKCKQNCRWEWDEPEVYERATYLDAFMSCMHAAPCRNVAQTDCEKRARADIVATPAVEAFCRESTEKDHACGIATDLGRCIDERKVLVDEVLASLEHCLDQPCDRFRRCFVGVYANGPS